MLTVQCGKLKTFYSSLLNAWQAPPIHTERIISNMCAMLEAMILHTLYGEE